MNANQLEHTAAVIGAITAFKQPADAVLSHYFRQHPKLGRQDRHEIAETAFAALRYWQNITRFFAPDKPDGKPDGKAAALAALVLGRGIGTGALEPLTTKELRERLGTLKAAKAQAAELCLRAELPHWLVEKMRSGGMDEAEIAAFGQAACQAAPLDLRVNTLKGKRAKVLAQLEEEGISAAAMPYAPHGIRLPKKIALNKHPLFENGIVEVQDEGSQLLVALTEAKRGMLVVDFCAGAGGKTLALGAMMNNQGRLYALDVSEKRLANLKPRLARSGLTNVTPMCIDSEADPRLARLAAKADVVLVDAPCSGLGTLRRNPDLKYRQNEQGITELCRLQARIFQAASALVKPGGRLVYATCSILPEENQDQVAAFLAANENFAPVRCEEILVGAKIPLIADKYLHLLPHQHHTDGFFAAVLHRLV